jgi:hypothetical protein
MYLLKLGARLLALTSLPFGKVLWSAFTDVKAYLLFDPEIKLRNKK